MPRMPWSLKTWAVALILAIFSALSLIDLQYVNFAAVILPFLALTIMGAGLLHRTPIVLMIKSHLRVAFLCSLLLRKQRLTFKNYPGPAIGHKLPDILVISTIRMR
jgi:hypothetical protein